MSPSPSKILLGIGITAILAAAGLVMVSQDAFGGNAPVLPNPGVEVDTAPDGPLSRPAEIGVRVTGDPAPDPGDNPGIDTAGGDGRGQLSGRIAISTRLLDSLTGKQFQITVEEDRNPNAHRGDAPKAFKAWRRFPFDFRLGTPVFDFPGVPFSRHPYRVTVSVPEVGVDGSSAITHVDPQHPRGRDEVELSISPGAIYSVMLRDQRLNPRAGLQVHMEPIGASVVRRERHSGTTNNFGNVVFEDVQRGDYKICVGTVDAPMAPPKEVAIHADLASVSRGKPQVQGTTIVVPDGREVRVEVFTKYGAVLPEARIKAWQLEVKQYFEFSGTTDQAGMFVLENVPSGTYQLNLEAAHHGRGFQKFTVDADQQGTQVVKITL